MKNCVEDGALQDVISVYYSDNAAGNFISGVGGMASKVSGFFQHVKHAVGDAVVGMKHAAEQMVSKVSGLFQHIFDQKADDKTDTAGGKEDGGSAFMGATVGQSVIGLAMLVIVVILLKRLP